MNQDRERLQDILEAIEKIERYTDQAAFDAHMGAERFAQLAGDLQDKLDGGVEMGVYEELAAKI